MENKCVRCHSFPAENGKDICRLCEREKLIGGIVRSSGSYCRSDAGRIIGVDAHKNYNILRKMFPIRARIGQLCMVDAKDVYTYLKEVNAYGV